MGGNGDFFAENKTDPSRTRNLRDGAASLAIYTAAAAGVKESGSR